MEHKNIIMNIVSKGLNFYFYRPTQFLKHSAKSIWHKLTSLELRGLNKNRRSLIFVCVCVCVSQKLFLLHFHAPRSDFMDKFIFKKIGRQGIVLCRLALSESLKVFFA